MQAWESDSDREMAERLVSESQRPAPTDGWLPFVSAPEGLREATPDEVQALRRALGAGDEGFVVGLCVGVLLGAAVAALFAVVLA